MSRNPIPVTHLLQTPQALQSPSLNEQLYVFAAALGASAIAVWWSWSHSAFLLYGDAEAHMHIARRIFDSHRPGIGQLGSVWLPMPHLLLMPFVAVDSWWRSGFAAIIPSATFYILGCLGLYRLARKWLPPAVAALALALFGANPNLLYMQTTAMTEPLFLCELIWSVLLLVEWYGDLDNLEHPSGKLLWPLIAVLLAGVFTRYDGWIMAFGAWVAMAICLARRKRFVRTGFIVASVLLLLGPVAWMAYNALYFGDWLDFMRGPYSALAIEIRTAGTQWPPHPGWHNPWVSALFFSKAAEMDTVVLGAGILLLIAMLGGMEWAWFGRVRHLKKLHPETADEHHAATANLATFLLWLPLPFYAYSVSFGSVPIFLPVWWPHSYYNTRYGMELLPAFALFFGFFLQGWAIRSRLPKYGGRWALTVLWILLSANVFAMLREKPLVYVEARKNSNARGYYNEAIPRLLGQLHQLDPNGLVLMDTSGFPSIVPRAGLTYLQTLNESDKQYFRAAIKSPATHAAIILAFAGDPVDESVKAHPEHLHLIETFHSKDQLDASLYALDTSPAANLSPALVGR